MADAASRLKAAAVILVAAYLGVGIYRAGLNELPPPSSSAQVTFYHGTANGERVESKSWSADYDTIVANQDQTIFQAQNVRHGVIYRKGKPYLRVRAQHMTVNMVSHDFAADGPVHVETVDAHPRRAFDTNSAVWNEAQQTLTLSGPLRISTGAPYPLRADRLTVNVGSGKLELIHVSGTIRFK
jgi:lipopolysaccharide export system protein LptA